MSISQPTIQWPITTIDFEASSLDPRSYPIEIGVARWESPGYKATVWSRLLRTTDEWRARNTWSSESAKIHNIDRASLQNGLNPMEAMTLLNERCPIGTLAFCDGGRFDYHWLNELAEAADIEAYLHLGSWHKLARSLGSKAEERIMNHRAPHEILHRAGADAADHIRALAWALDLPEPEFVDLDQI